MCELPDDGIIVSNHVGATVIYFNVESLVFYKCIYCALFGREKIEWDKMHSERVKILSLFWKSYETHQYALM